MSIISNVVNRLHVSASAREVIRALNKALKKKHRRDPKLRTDRKAMYKDGIAQHEANRELVREWRF